MFLRWSAACLLIASFYLFMVIPHAQTFETLVGMLSVPYLGIGMLIQRPGFNLIAMLLSVNTGVVRQRAERLRHKFPRHLQYEPGQCGGHAVRAGLGDAGAALSAPMWPRTGCCARAGRTWRTPPRGALRTSIRSLAPGCSTGWAS
jgi:hypothetical protein